MQERAIAAEALKRLSDPDIRGQAKIEDVSKWSRRLVESTRKSGASNAEVIEAIEQHIARMDGHLKVIQRLHEAAIVPHTDLLNAEYESLEAKGWLLAEQRK